MKLFSNILALSVCCISILLLADPVFFFIYNVGLKLFGHVTSSLYNDWMISLLSLFVTLILIVDASKSNFAKWKQKRVTMFVAITIFYITSRFNHSYTFTTFACCNEVAYTDALYIPYLCWFVSPYILLLFKKKKRKLEMGKYPENIIGDDIHPKDMLGRKHEAKAVCNYLLNTTNDNTRALAMAITGTWGSGKSTFLSYLKDILNDEKVSYFDYNPWNRSVDNVSVDFLTHLQTKIQNEGAATRGLTCYIHSIKVSNATGWFSLILEAFLHIITDRSKSTQGHLQDVKLEMQSLERPIVAIIDDVDRVSAEDFRDVLGLVRSTADFPNLVYILAYDTERACELLGKGGDKYLSKIFNLTHALVPIDEDMMQSLVGETLNDYFMHCSLDSMYDNPFSTIIIKEYLDTMRDMYRLVNMMYKDYKVQEPMRCETYFDFNFWAIMELLKYHDYVTWNLLQSSPLKYLDLDVSDWCEPVRYKLKDTLELNDSTTQLLQALFLYSDSIYRSPEYLPLVFANDVDLPYVKNSEIEKAITPGKINLLKPSDAGGMRNLYISLLYHDCLSLQQIIEMTTLFLRDDDSPLEIDASNKFKILRSIGESATQADMSMVKEMSSPFRKIRDHHELYLWLAKYLSRKGEQGISELMECLRDSNVSIREMMALIYGIQQMDLTNDTLPPQWKVEAGLLLTDRLFKECNMKELISQYYMMEAFEYLHVYDPVNMFVLPYIKKDLPNWLRLTIRQCTTVTESVITADVDVMRTMFDTFEVYIEAMKSLEQEFVGLLKTSTDEMKADIQFNITLIKEHSDLVRRTELAGVYSNGIFDESNYPALKSILCPDCTTILTMGCYYNTLCQRIKKKDVPFYFGKSRHPYLFA